VTLQRKAPLLRKAELRSKSYPRPWRRPNAEKVTPEDRQMVLERDGYRCVAPMLAVKYDLPTPDACRDRWGRLAIAYITADGPVYRPEALTYEHVRLTAAMGGRKPAPSLRTSLTACDHHNVNGWCQANKRYERQYLAELYGGTDDTE